MARDLIQFLPIMGFPSTTSPSSPSLFSPTPTDCRQPSFLATVATLAQRELPVPQINKASQQSFQLGETVHQVQAAHTPPHHSLWLNRRRRGGVGEVELCGPPSQVMKSPLWVENSLPLQHIISLKQYKCSTQIQEGSFPWR